MIVNGLMMVCVNAVQQRMLKLGCVGGMSSSIKKAVCRKNDSIINHVFLQITVEEDNRLQ